MTLRDRPSSMLGKTIGNYIVRHKLGEGGMGSVYFAEHPAIGKRVALKVLHPDFASEPEIVSRFFNEAKTVNDIQHPNIIDIVDFGTIPAGEPTEHPLVYFIMEYVEGATLTELIRREAPLAPERAVAIALQIADALSASHGKGVIHRDLKPDNVMLMSRGRQRDFVKLLDFGIAKLSGARAHKTRTGTVMGTPQYMSPEQCDGRGQIDHRSDIYALGIVVYQMLTGRVPFGGEGHGEVMIQQMTKPPLAPSRIAPHISEHLELIVLKALEKRPEDRFQRVDDMMLALQDPMKYVAAHGGRGGFLTSPVVREPRAAAATAVIAATTASASHPVPTTLSGSASQAVGLPPPPRKRFPIGFSIAVGAFVVAVVAGIIFQGSGQGSDQSSKSSRPATPPASTPEPTTPPAPVQPPIAAPIATPTAPTPTAPTPTAPTPAAPAAPTPTAPSKPVHVKVSSTPPGAIVTIDRVARGRTPYAGELPRREKPVELTLALPGYLTVTRTITLDGNLVLSLPLEPAPKPAPAPAQ